MFLCKCTPRITINWFCHNPSDLVNHICIYVQKRFSARYSLYKFNLLLAREIYYTDTQSSRWLMYFIGLVNIFIVSHIQISCANTLTYRYMHYICTYVYNKVYTANIKPREINMRLSYLIELFIFTAAPPVWRKTQKFTRAFCFYHALAAARRAAWSFRTKKHLFLKFSAFG